MSTQATAKQGSLTVICGGMFSQKSDTLISALNKLSHSKQKVVAFKPSIDTRYSNDSIAAHDGSTFCCLPIPCACPESILQQVTHMGAGVVGIDEIQFFDAGIVAVVRELVRSGKRVFAAGLDMDSTGEPFGSMPTLLSIATVVKKKHAICTVCGEEASYSQRIVGGVSATVFVGGKDQYAARCGSHWSPLPEHTDAVAAMGIPSAL